MYEITVLKIEVFSESKNSIATTKLKRKGAQAQK